MYLGVGGVVELLRHEVAGVLLHELFRGEHRAGHAFNRRGEHELRAVTLQQLATLTAHVVRHGQDQVVALGGRDHRQAYARVTTRRFDDGGAGLQAAGSLGLLDH